MKSVTIIIFSLIGMAVPSFGALYTLDNGLGASASGIQTLSGATFRAGTTAGTAFTGTNAGISAGPGVLAIGFFKTEDFSGFTSTAQFVEAFTQFGSAGTFAGAGPTGQRSIFSHPTVGTVTGSAFSGKNIFLFVGSGDTLAGSSELLILKTITLFNDGRDSEPTPLTVTVRPDATTTALFGVTNANVWTTNSDSVISGGWTTAAVPEPSAALLGALGALGLLRRRRN